MINRRKNEEKQTKSKGREGAPQGAREDEGQKRSRSNLIGIDKSSMRRCCKEETGDEKRKRIFVAFLWYQRGGSITFFPEQRQT